MAQKPGRPVEKFNKAIVVAADDGRFYYLPEEVYTDDRFLVDERSAEYAKVKGLADQGVNLAAVPEPPDATDAGKGVAGEQIVVACYLVNVASLRYHTVFEDE